MWCRFVEQGWAWLGRGFSNDVKCMTRKTKKNILEDNNVMTLAAVVIIRRRRRRQEARKYTENGLVDGVRLERYPRSCDDIVDTVLGGFHNFAVIVSSKFFHHRVATPF